MRIFRMVAVCWLVLLCSCTETKVWSGPPFPLRFTITGVTLSNTLPTAGETVTATINFQGVSGPFTFTLNFTDAVTPAIKTVSAPNGATATQVEFTLDEFSKTEQPDGKDCVLSVTGADANGTLAGPVMGSFHVEGRDV